MVASLPPERKVALVTGAGRRIGRAVALRLARQGYNLCIHYHTSKGDAEHLREEISAGGGAALCLGADLADPLAIEHMFDQLHAQVGRLDVLINSAAIMPGGDWVNQTVETWDAVMAVNLRAPWLCARRAAHMMAPGGVIINLADSGVGNLWGNYFAYSISKNGLEMLTRLLAKSLAPNVRVNAVAPGLVMPSAELTEEAWERLVGRLPLQRASTPEEIAAAVLSLIENQAITGQILAVDGGYQLI